MEDVLNEIKGLKLIVIGELIEIRDLISKMNEKIDDIKVQNAYTKEEGIDALGYYSTSDVIGSGSKATVYEVITRDNNAKYAMKAIDMHKNQLTLDMAREITTLSDVKHSNIVKLEEVFSHGNLIYLIMEHAGQDLNIFLQLYGKQPVEITKAWLRELLSAVDFIHKKGLIHRDLKPENIMIGSEKNLKVADFGSVIRCFDDTDLSPAVTTVPFRAPEIHLGCDVYGKAIDMWAVGCIFAEMMEGEGLFGPDSEFDIIHQIFRKIGAPSPQSWMCNLPNFPKDDLYQYPEVSQIVPSLDVLGDDLLKKMLVIDPFKRITAEEALNHPYLKEKGSFCAFKPLILVEASKVAEAIHFYKSVFGAEEVRDTHAKRKADQELPLICAELKLAATNFLISNDPSEAL
ncbi:cyclin-dependent kinase A-1-like isoform X2 [Apium graveolens]